MDDKHKTLRSSEILDNRTNSTRNRYQSGKSLNKSTVNRSRVASGAKGLAQSKLTLIKTKPIANAGKDFLI